MGERLRVRFAFYRAGPPTCREDPPEKWAIQIPNRTPRCRQQSWRHAQLLARQLRQAPGQELVSVPRHGPHDLYPGAMYPCFRYAAR